MITLFQINKAINDILTNALSNTEFKEVKLVDEDLKEPIERPSIKVKIGDSTTGRFNDSNKERTLIVRVHFFAKNKEQPKLENLKMREIIENIFTLHPLKITDDFFIDINEVQSNVSDGVLICSFDIETLELIPESILDDGIEYEPMENLDIEMKEG